MAQQSEPKKEPTLVNTQRQGGSTRVQNSETGHCVTNKAVRIANIREADRASIVRPPDPPRPKK